MGKNKDYLDTVLEACEQFNSEFDGTFDRSKAEENLSVEEIKLKYELQDDIVVRLLALKSFIETKRQKFSNFNEFIVFLKSAMNYDDMQIWLLREQMAGVNLTLNDELKKFFELNSNDDILRIYDVEENYGQNNIDGIRRTLVNNKK